MQNTKRKLLAINNLKKYFPVGKASAFGGKQRYVRANEDITIDIYEGETLGLVGESGCGKSTFGRVLLQLYPQTAGSTMYYGRTLDEMAPKYVGHTLKNAKKMVDEYFAARKKADEAIAACEQAGDSLTYEQNSQKDELVFAAENALSKTAKILGGFMGVSGLEAAAKLLLEQYEAQVALYRLRQEREQLQAKQDGKADGKLKDLDGKIAAQESKCAAAQAAVEAERSKYRGHPEFYR